MCCVLGENPKNDASCDMVKCDVCAKEPIAVPNGLMQNGNCEADVQVVLSPAEPTASPVGLISRS